MKRTLLIDADIVAYQSSAATEQVFDWGDGVVSRSTDLKAAQKSAKDEVEWLADKLKADAVIICLSDDLSNFRKVLYPEYKNNRSSTARPEHLYDIKEWLAAEYPTELRPHLEADDVMGILSTEPHDGQRIIVSEDKDMQTVPGWLFNPRKDKKPRLITEEQAERFLLWQTLTGDTTDGYPGCPGVGPKMADQVLDGLMWAEETRVLRSGPRKGEEVVEWVKRDDPSSTVWSRIVAVYARFGLKPKDAILQANLARILKHTDMDGTRILPWKPSDIKSAN